MGKEGQEKAQGTGCRRGLCKRKNTMKLLYIPFFHPCLEDSVYIYTYVCLCLSEKEWVSNWSDSSNISGRNPRRDTNITSWNKNKKKKKKDYWIWYERRLIVHQLVLCFKFFSADLQRHSVIIIRTHMCRLNIYVVTGIGCSVRSALLKEF